MAQQQQTAAEGGDLLIAESAASEAEKHKDPMEEHRKWAHAHYQTLLSGGMPPQMAVMEVMNQAQKTGDAEIAEAVRQACETLPVDTTQ